MLSWAGFAGAQLMELQEEMEKMQAEFQEAARKLTEDKDGEISRLENELEELKQKNRTVEQFLLDKLQLEAKLADLEVRCAAELAGARP